MFNSSPATVGERPAGPGGLYARFVKRGIDTIIAAVKGIFLARPPILRMSCS